MKILGHRGAPTRAPENTLAAFVEARRMGADGVELDVRRAPDGRLLVHHDPLPTPVPPSVPTLVEALEVCAGMIVNVEVKNLPGQPDYDATEAVATAVGELLGRRCGEDLIVSSFNLASVDAVRAAAPSLATGWLTLPGFDQAAAAATAAERGHSALHPHEQAVTPEVVAAIHRAGLTVTTWTVDDPERMRALTDMGVDVMITNVPDVAVATLR